MIAADTQTLLVNALSYWRVPANVVPDGEELKINTADMSFSLIRIDHLISQRGWRLTIQPSGGVEERSEHMALTGVLKRLRQQLDPNFRAGKALLGIAAAPIQ